MKYLDSKPFNIGLSADTEHRPQVVETGGPATRIPDDAKCPSGRHNRRLTECYCAPPTPETYCKFIDGRMYVKMPDGTLMQYRYVPPEDAALLECLTAGLERK